jgi:transposase
VLHLSTPPQHRSPLRPRHRRAPQTISLRKAFKLRQFAKASGILAKSDRLDARVIASFIAIMPTRPARLRRPAIERLAGMLAVRRQLNAEKVAAENAPLKVC